MRFGPKCLTSSGSAKTLRHSAARPGRKMSSRSFLMFSAKGFQKPVPKSDCPFGCKERGRGLASETSCAEMTHSDLQVVCGIFRLATGARVTTAEKCLVGNLTFGEPHVAVDAHDQVAGGQNRNLLIGIDDVRYPSVDEFGEVLQGVAVSSICRLRQRSAPKRPPNVA